MEHKQYYTHTLHPQSYPTEDGTKKPKEKLAPRSSLQFKVGPEFSETTQGLSALYSTLAPTTPVISRISARIDRGFEKEGDEWIGYKRNYFTLVSSFEFESISLQSFLETDFFVMDNYNNPVGVRLFGLKLISTCVEDGTYVNLVQHTAKRDRGPQLAPPVYPAVPGVLPDHDTIKEAANVRNSSKIERINRLFYLSDMDYRNGCPSPKTLARMNGCPSAVLSKVARYERVQFSSSINYRKPSSVVRHFNLVVQLIAHLENGHDVVVGFIESPSLIIRGRSPSNYAKEKGASEMHLLLQEHTFHRPRSHRPEWPYTANHQPRYRVLSDNETTDSPDEAPTPHDEYVFDPRILEATGLDHSVYLAHMPPATPLECGSEGAQHADLEMIDTLIAQLHDPLTVRGTAQRYPELQRSCDTDRSFWRPLSDDIFLQTSDENTPISPSCPVRLTYGAKHLNDHDPDPSLEFHATDLFSPLNRLDLLSTLNPNTQSPYIRAPLLSDRLSFAVPEYGTENIFDNPSDYLKGLETLEDTDQAFFNLMD